MKKLLFAAILLFSVVTSTVAQEAMLGEIRMFAGNFAPRGWALCNGQLLPIAQNSALFSLLGTTYGGDGRTTFGLPDLRSRVPVHAGDGPGLTTYRLGQKGGAEQVTITTNQIPAHTHSVSAQSSTEVKVLANSTESESVSPNSNYPAKSKVTTYMDETDSTYLADPIATTTTQITESSVGGSQAHENRMPFVTVNFIIATTGIFPSRQ